MHENKFCVRIIFFCSRFFAEYEYRYWIIFILMSKEKCIFSYFYLWIICIWKKCVIIFPPLHHIFIYLYIRWNRFYRHLQAMHSIFCGCGFGTLCIYNFMWKIYSIFHSENSIEKVPSKMCVFQYPSQKDVSLLNMLCGLLKPNWKILY